MTLTFNLEGHDLILFHMLDYIPYKLYITEQDTAILMHLNLLILKVTGHFLFLMVDCIVSLSVSQS